MKSISAEIDGHIRHISLSDSTNESNDIYRQKLGKLMDTPLDNYGECETYVFVRTDTDGIIGMMRFVIDATGCAMFRNQFGANWDKPVAWGADIWIDPKYQGKGLSKRLITEIEQNALEKGMGYMTVKVWKDSKNYKWYAKAGYDESRETEDSTLFVKTLKEAG